MPRDVLPPFHNIVARTERCVQRTLLFGPYFFNDKIVRWTRGGGGGSIDVNVQIPETPAKSDSGVERDTVPRQGRIMKSKPDVA